MAFTASPPLTPRPAAPGPATQAGNAAQWSRDAESRIAGRLYVEALNAVRHVERLRRRLSGGIAAVIIALLAVVPLSSPGSFNLDRYGVAVAYVLAALGLNLAFGFAGELAIGFAAIMAVGAYSAGLLSVLAGWGGVPTLIAATALGTAFGALTMMPGLRVQGWYLALITMFSVLVVPHLVVLGEAWTGGEYGLTGVKAFDAFGLKFSGIAMFELIVAAFAIVWWLQANFLRSGWGLRLQAIRDARHAAEAVGIPVQRTRATVYVLAAIPAALSGALLAYAQRFVNYDAFNMSLTLLLLTGVVLGGAGRLWGPLIGMTPLLILSFWVGPFSPYNAVALGLGLMVGVLIFTDGLVSALERVAAKRLPGLFVSAARVSGRDVDAPSTGSSAPVEGRNSAARAKDAQRNVLISVRGVRKRFGGLQALSGVDFDLHEGRLCGLVGPNGSGKSTFLNTLSGFIRPDEGEIRIGAANVATMAPHQIAAAGIGRTFQVPQLVEELSALENIELGLLAQEPMPILASLLRTPAVRRRAESRRERALAALQLVGLPVSAVSEPVEKLPLGLKRTVEVARAVVVRPKMLLLDEPAAGLNDTERVELGSLLRKLIDEGITVLVVEHNVPFVLSVCDELVLLESGAVRDRADLDSPLPKSLAEYLNFAPQADHDGDAATGAAR